MSLATRKLEYKYFNKSVWIPIVTDVKEDTNHVTTDG